MHIRSVAAAMAGLLVEIGSANDNDGRLDYVVQSGTYTQMLKPFQCHQLEHPGPIYKATGEGLYVEFYSEANCQGSKKTMYGSGSLIATEFFDPPFDTKSVVLEQLAFVGRESASDVIETPSTKHIHRPQTQQQLQHLQHFWRYRTMDTGTCESSSLEEDIHFPPSYRSNPRPFRPRPPPDPSIHTPILLLPSELIYQIVSYLSPTELTSLSSTCHTFREHIDDDRVWAKFVNENLPTPLASPSPFDSFRSLYISHHPLWFVVRNKIWFSDAKNTGRVILARYDHRRGCIEAYRLVASHSFRHMEAWSKDPSVLISSFDPTVSLWLDDPVVQLEKFVPTITRPNLGWRNSEIPMPMALEHQRVFSSFILCKKASARATAALEGHEDGSGNTDNANGDDDSSVRAMWPPELIPSEERVDATYCETPTYKNTEDKPERLDDICQTGFRLRRWVQFGSQMAVHGIGAVVDGMSTYATLSPELYTPTEKKPYQGIWVGDYSGHGPEFLLVLQRDKGPSVTTESVDPAQSNGNSVMAPSGAPEAADPAEIGGPLEAIKLTGDPNVPRGEITFMAEDIGPRGLIRIADEEVFKGARVVRSQGHIAETNFRNDQYMASELILVSHDCLAHYWTGLHHISYYRRVNIDELLRL